MESSNDSNEALMRSGTVALIGRSNVGKSTLLNAALSLPLAIVSRKPQTTRVHLLGIVRHGNAEIGLLDTPGIHRAKSQLGREMNRAARIATHNADVVLFVIAIPPKAKGELRVHPGDRELLRSIPKEVPVVLVINKIDLLASKQLLLPLIPQFNEDREFAAVVPISALRDNGIQRVLDEAARLLPEGAPQHGEDELTNRPARYFAGEYVREAMLAALGQEVPHAAAITIDEYIEPTGAGAVQVSATIHVERNGQKQILIGKGGAMLKRIGTQARKRLEELIDHKVNLKLWARVTKNWRESGRQLSEMGLLAKQTPDRRDKVTDE